MVVCHAIWNSSQRGNPLSTQEVLPAWKGELIGSFFFMHKKMKEVAVVTLDEGVRGMCGEINPFRIGEQFPFYNLCVLDHITHTYLEPPAGFFGFFNPIHAPLSHQNQKLDFFHFRVWLYPVSRCCWYLTLEVCIKSSQRGSEASMLMEKFNYDNVSLCLDKDDL